MKKVILHQEPLSRRYCAPRLSLTYAFVILCNVFALVFPLYFCLVADGDLWKRYGSYREQPDVKFQYKFIMVLEATSTASGQTKEIFVSSMDSLNVMRPKSHRMANVRYHQDDADLDGKLDSFILEAEVPLAADEQIQSMQAALFLDVRLQERVKFDMESVAYTSFESALPVSGYDSKGSLVLRQAHPLGIRGYFSALYADETPLVDADDSANLGIADTNIGSILEKFRERDVAADYVERYPIKYRAADSEDNGTFHLKMKVDIPEQEVMYIPTLVEVLKDGWVKYLSIAFLVWLMLERIKSFVFSQHLLYSKVLLNVNMPGQKI